MTIPTNVPEFPDDWIVTGSKEMAVTAVWLNGVNISDRCVAFEKLYTAGTAYWGSACIFVKVGPTIGLEPIQPGKPMPMIYMFRRGILVWESVMDLPQEDL